MELLIIENVWMGGAKYGFFDKTLLTMFSVLPTLHARRMAAITPKKHNIEFINERYKDIDFDRHYDIVNINYATSSAPRAYEIADRFRKKDVKVVLSGLHASGLTEEAKQHADSVLLGLGELNWLELLNDLEKKEIKPFYQPKNYDESIRIPPTDVKLPGFVMTGAVEATRGCPYGCEFCRETNIPGGSTFYKRPIDEVISEIKSLPQRVFTFYDNSLTVDPEYTKMLFRKMKGMHKRFSCNGNVNTLANDEELVRLSRQAGCFSWIIGFESVSQETLDEVSKKTNKIIEYEKAINNIHNNKMSVIGYFVFGFDSDTKDVFEKTLEMIRTWMEDGFEMLFSSGQTRKRIKKAIKYTKHYPDYIVIERLGFLETAVFLKKGTSAPGILADIGPHLKNTHFSMFRPMNAKAIFSAKNSKN